MKDRYDNFFDAQQDPYEYDADDENNAEEYEEDELEDEESPEDDDESYEDEELEDDEDEPDDEEYAEEEEEEEEVPAAPAASSRPFGNSLNIQLNDRNRPSNNHNNQGSAGRPGGSAPQNRPQGADRGMVFKQVRPATPAAGGYTMASARPETPNQAARPAQAASPVRETRKDEDSRASAEGGRFVESRKSDADRISSDDRNEFETPKKGFFSRLAPWNRMKSHDAEIEDETVDSKENEALDEQLVEDDVERPGRFRRFLSFFSRSSAENEAEEDEDAESGEDDASKTGVARLGRRVSKKFSSLSNRVRGRLRTGESLDEFKEELTESEEDDGERPHGRFRRLVKIGMIGGAAALLIFVCRTGYRHLTGSGKNADPASADLASFDGQGNDTLNGLSSRADSGGLETTPLDSIAEGFDALGDKISDQVDSLAGQVNSLSGKVGEKIDSVTAELTSSANNALDTLSDDLLANDDFLGDDSSGGDSLDAAGAAVGAAAGAAVAAGVAALSGKESASDDQLDFGFDSPEEDPLSVSETTPAYGDNQGSGGLSFDQLKENLADAGEQLKDGFKSGVEKVDDSLKKAGEKTGEFFDNAGQKLSGAAQDFKDDMAQAGEQAQDAAQKVGNWASNTYDAAKEKVGDAAANVKSGLSQAETQAQDAAQKTGDWASNTYDAAKEKVGDAAANVKNGLSQAGTQAQAAAQKVGDWASETFQAPAGGNSVPTAAPQSAAGAVPAAAPQSTVGTLQSNAGQTQGLSLGQRNQNEPLFLETSNQGKSAASSLGGSADQFRSASTAVSGGRNTPLGSSSSLAAGGSLGAASLTQGGGDTRSSLGNTTSAAPPASNSLSLQNNAPAGSGVTGSLGNTAQSSLPAQSNTIPPAAPVSTAPAEIQDALAQEAAAARSAAAQQAEVVQGQTPAETFAAEADLSMIGFEAPRVEDGAPLSDSLSPFGGQYSLPEETVPAADLSTAAVGAGQSAGGALAPQSGPQLSTSNYNSAAPSALTQTNNVAQAGTPLSGNNFPGAVFQGSEYRQYRTKDGDNLIKIAENELGDGTRWAEISKLNPNMNLRGRLDEGLIILLPPKNSGN